MMSRQSRRGLWVGAAAVLLGVIGPAAGPVQAGKRLAPIAPLCASGTKEIDSDGEKDRCVTRAKATCEPGHTLAVDAVGEGDRCVADAGAGKPAEAAAKAAKPKCAPGLQLAAKKGEDACEHAEKPTCLSGFSLDVRQKEDFCRH